MPPHRQRAYADGWAHTDFPIADALHRGVVSLPLNPALTDDEQTQCIQLVNTYTE